MTTNEAIKYFETVLHSGTPREREAADIALRLLRGMAGGHWIPCEEGDNLWECSICGATDTHPPDRDVQFCWHCGAEMFGIADNPTKP